jgi:tetratricopeptide (TPR) repeat protein
LVIDLTPLWDFSNPELSEQRFIRQLESAAGDDAFIILKSQIARTYGLRKNFSQAQDILKSIANAALTAGPEARARYWLELGRTYASATHPLELRTPENQQLARQAFEKARSIATTGQLDGLAIDAIHMLAFVDTAPADQLKWGQEALKVIEASNQPEAKKWEASVRNNVGYALHQLGRLEEALIQFQQALVIHERSTNAQAIGVAHWMVAWTLRGLNRMDEALAIQLRLEREFAASNTPDPYVFEELETIYRARGDETNAKKYAELRRASASSSQPN